MATNLLGTRVVRGQDWTWGDQDGGEGSVGTVVQVGKDKKSPVTAQLVYVQWDCGGKHEYRAGIERKHDLRVFSLTNGDAKHLFTSCDGCKEDPIIGLRWHCLDCPNYDLCSKCYMNDVHDVNHRFERFDKSRVKGIPVGKRQGATKIEARGMFKGAKVTRGPDWEWKEQDNQSPMEGEVTEVTSWSDETNNDAVRVNWNIGPTGNIYRLGTNGKVDLKCTLPAVGGYYYKDHLPPLTVQIIKSKSGFMSGDKVYLQKLAIGKLQELSAGHGEWNADMERYIGKIGVVQDFTTNGDVVVEYRDVRWRYNPAVLSKIQKFKQGDEVVVKSDENLVKELQKEHGGWHESMISILGRTGKVLEVDSDGDILVSVEGTRWMLSPAAVTSVTDPDLQQSTEACDMGSEDPLGLFSLFRDLLRQAHEQEAHGLVNAAQSNNLSRLIEILDANPERIDELEGGHTALHVACHQGHCEIIRELVERGANMDILDNQGYTAMHHSTYQDESGEALKLLLEKGFDPNVQHRSNKSTPLHLAVKRKNETAVQILTQCPECDVNLQDEAGDTPLHDAIRAEHHSMVDMLLECPRICYTLCNGKGFNYLQHAVLKGDKRAVEKVFAKTGNSLNVVKNDGFTTLHIAAINDHREIANILLKKPGCEVDALTAKNQSALHLAANEGYSVMVGILLDHGASVNAVDDDGDTALHITLIKEHVFQRNPEVMPGLELLLGVRKSSVPFVAVSRCLLSYGADVLKVNGSGETPLDRCRGSEVEQLIRKIAACGGATNNKKVPSFGSSSGSQTEPELGDASSSARAVTQTDETEKDHGIQTDKIGSTDEAEDAFLRDVIKDLCRGDREDIRADIDLVNAARSNNLSRVKEILDAKPEWIDKLVGGHTALHVACRQGHCDIIAELLERGANMDILDNQGYTAMHHSTYQDESGEALKLLLERGFDPNVQHRSNKSTPLHLAVKRKNETAVQILTKCPECDVNLQDEAGDTPLHDAILAEHHSMVDMLLECPRICYTLCNGKGFNYLQHAVLKGDKRAVERVFAKTGNSLNVVKNDGFTTLHIAAINDHREIAKILLKKPGCEVDAVTSHNHSALHLAASKGHSVMAGMLLDHGANVNAVDDDGDTALHITLMKEHVLKRNPAEMPGLELLLGERKSSASFVAVSRCLLSYGADVLKVNGSGETPLDRCRGSEVEQLIRKIAAGGGTTDNKKVPSFGSSSGSQTKPELSDPSFSASAATLTEETENEDKNQTDRMGSTDETEDTFLRGVIRDLCRGNQEDIRADIGLVNAAQNNNLSRVKEILDSNPEQIDKLVGGHSALHVACHQGHCDIIRELLERGANMDILDNQGYTAMHHSTYQDESGEALKLLLEKGFDPNVQHRSNRSTPLHLAVKRKNETAVQILTQCPECDVNLKDETGEAPLHHAILLQHHSMVDMLLDCPRVCVTLYNGKGFNYLQLAVLKGDKRAVERIFATTGNSLNVVKNDGFTTLHIAAISDHLEIAKILLEKPGCEVDAATAENQSALHLAADKGHSVMVELLLDHGANVNAVDSDGDTALHIALMKEHTLQRNMGFMPGLELLLGVRNSSASVVAMSRCLLSYGADVLKVNGSGKTPLDICRGSEVEQLIRKIAAGGGTTRNKKVPSFGSSSESRTKPESEDASSSASAATVASETEKGDENQTDSTNNTDEAEETFLQRVISDLTEEMSDEMESEDVQEGVTAESVSEKPALVQNIMMEDTLCQENVVLEMTNKVEVETWALDISNDSAVQPAEMVENNTDTKMGDSEGPPSQTSDDQKVLCYICEETEAVVAFKPCGHTVVCIECAARLKRCLECKTPISGKGTRDGNPIIGINNKSLVSQYQQLEAKLRKLEESVVCCICVERKKDIIFRCGHGACQFCVKQLSVCHICQKPIEMKIQTF